MNALRAQPIVCVRQTCLHAVSAASTSKDHTPVNVQLDTFWTQMVSLALVSTQLVVKRIEIKMT